MSTTLLRDAIRRGLTHYAVAGVSIALGSVATDATAQNADNSDQKGQSLETIVVTGSNIRRVDIETANPVLTIDHAQIQQSGKLTLGDLVQSLPSMAGSAVNTAVNNGGGTGAATISLRGLGTNRSLLLINGHRIPFQLQDLNIIPVAAVERIEVLTDGSSAVYGSDAVAGVVNIITRTNYQGAEFGADYGISDRDDGARKAYHMLFGQSTDKGSIMLGINYNKNDAVSAANRAYSHDALYKYNTGYINHGGSSRTPNGAINLPASLLAQYGGCPGSGSRVTRIAGAAGSSPNDYRCYNSKKDAFNYQAVGNYDQTPGERAGLYALANYKLSDSVEAFAEVFHNKTVSQAQIAPVPLDALQDNLYIPSNQYYNPFGVAFGIAPDGSSTNEFKTRLTTLGNRQAKFSTTHDLATTGLKGNFADSSWNWFADVSYGKITAHQTQGNFINYSKLAANFACTQLSCNPIDIFNITDPNTIALLTNAKTNYYNSPLNYQMRSGEAGVSGSLFELPAGSLQLAAGVSYRKEYIDSTTDSGLTTNLIRSGDNVNLVCSGPGSICASPVQGGFNVKEAYAELLIPVVKDLPFVHSLNIDVGTRYSKYSNFGSTNNWKIAVELKPIEDLLIRGTVSKVFRAPSVTDLFGGPATDSPTAVDPCGPASLASNPLCQGYTFQNSGTGQLTAIVTGSQYANANLGTHVLLTPENGKSFDYGFVYDPSWLPGLSVNTDYYRIVLNNLIVSGPGIAQQIINQCFAGDAAICQLIIRTASGSDKGNIKYVYEAAFNSGNLVTQGADFGAHYRLPETPFGNFRVGLQATYIQRYDINSPGFSQHYAGHFDKTFGNLARWRYLGNLDWNWGAFNASYQARVVGSMKIGYPSAALGPSAANLDTVYGPADPVFHYGAQTYHNISFGYNIEPWNTMVQLGIDNLSDKQPPILYQNNVANANTDVSNYDTIGRFFFAKVTVKF